jgi:hypothetical protein
MPGQAAVIPGNDRFLHCLALNWRDSLAQKWPPPTDLLVGVELRSLQISKDSPAAKACCSADSPEPDSQRESGWSIILSQPEDHRRTVTRHGIDRSPAATQQCFCHDCVDLSGLLRRLSVTCGSDVWATG